MQYAKVTGGREKKVPSEIQLHIIAERKRQFTR